MSLNTDLRMGKEDRLRELVRAKVDIIFAAGLIEQLSSENFEPENYEDEYRNRVRAMLDNKVKGQEITVPPKAPARGHIIDLMEALKESMKTVERGKKRAEQKKRRKA